jgi:hypothetical protein
MVLADFDATRADFFIEVLTTTLRTLGLAPRTVLWNTSQAGFSTSHCFGAPRMLAFRGACCVCSHRALPFVSRVSTFEPCAQTREPRNEQDVLRLMPLHTVIITAGLRLALRF